MSKYRVKIKSPWFDNKGMWFEIWVSTTFIPMYKPIKTCMDMYPFSPRVENLMYSSIEEAEWFVKEFLPDIQSYRNYVNEFTERYNIMLNRYNSRIKPKTNKTIKL